MKGKHIPSQYRCPERPFVKVKKGIQLDVLIVITAYNGATSVKENVTKILIFTNRKFGR